MKFLEYIPLFLSLSSGSTIEKRTVQGLDISRYQNNPNLTEAHTVGLSFVYIKATEGPTYTDPRFSEHYREATDASFLRAGYHVARTDLSDGATQAQFFLSNGGGWTADGKTLPGLLSIGMDDHCAGLTPQETQEWIKQFVETYEGATKRAPVIGTTNEWWVECTGNTPDFNEKSPLLLAHWGNSVGMIPGGWQFATIWQYKEGGAWGGNSNIFSGDAAALRKLADG
jgi:GH25 family lysozyme M1 (1,4-beta-N-acetylmuramidase)